LAAVTRLGRRGIIGVFDTAQAELFEKTAPASRVIRTATASHFIWRSNEADVLRKMNAFMDGSPKH
jgi:hypothetical protein